MDRAHWKVFDMNVPGRTKVQRSPDDLTRCSDEVLPLGVAAGELDLRRAGADARQEDDAGRAARLRRREEASDVIDAVGFRDRQQERRPHALERRRDRVLSREVAHGLVDPGPPVGHFALVAREDPDLLARGEELLDELLADVPGGTRDQVHACLLPGGLLGSIRESRPSRRIALSTGPSHPFWGEPTTVPWV
ncbi:hypothetical protein BE18_38205 [Sorangium cellulosum]|uniref:Uncharacterized protein n=1 Tax=Sorangium cellulosum TaxID=56 RepID=A0A150RL55_SORCE|nr:hypothetical protein BE18_38205 [Sorangium cellulosum]